MKMMNKFIVTLLAIVCVAGFANAQTVTIDSSDTVITLDVANTNWFASDLEIDAYSVGLSLYKLDTAGTFDYYMRASTEVNSLKTMFQPENHYEFTYGATAKINNSLYAYGGLGFVSDFGHKDTLLGTANYGVLARSGQWIFGLGDDTNAGATVSLGKTF